MTEVFTYTVAGGRGGPVSTTLTITVTGTNDRPVIGAESELAGDVADATPGAGEATGRLASTDVDAGATAVWSLNGAPDGSYGSFTLAADGSWRFVLDSSLPATQALLEGQEITLAYPVRVTDQHGAYAVTEVTITVTGASNTAVIGGVSEGAVIEAGGVSNGIGGTPSTGGTLTVVDGDAGDDGFRIPAPADLTGTYGSFTFNPATGAWTYALDNSLPATQALPAGQQVTETLTVESFDGSASRMITVTVTGSNDVPVVTDGSAALVEDMGVDPAGNLVASGALTIDDLDRAESEFDPATLTFVPATPGAVALGTMVLDADGTWTYRIGNSLPGVQALAAGEVLTETWTVRSLDGSATSTIMVTVTGTNDDPVIAGEAVGTVREDTPGETSVTGQLTVGDVDTTDSHEWTIPGATGNYGTLVVDPATGEWTYTLDNSNPAVQALIDGESLTDVITVQVDDGNGGVTTQDVTITIRGSNEVPVAEDESGTTDENTVLTVPGPGLLANDRDDNGDDLVVSTVGADTPVVAGGTQIAGSTGGVFTVYPDGSYSFDPDGDFDNLAVGEQRDSTLSYAISDGNGGSATATLTITVTGTNDAPEISTSSDLTGLVTEVADNAVGENTVIHSQTGDIRFVDADLTDSHAVAFTPEGTGYLGSFTLTPPAVGDRDVRWSFTVPDAVLDSLPAGTTLEQRYEVRITDGSGAFTTETVVITIEGRNDAPEPEDDITLIAGGQVAAQDVLANDADADAGETATLQVTAVEGQAILPGQTITLADGRGTVSLTGRGDLSFTPAPGVLGQVTLTYTVDDGSGTANATATADWVINVVGVEMLDDASPASPTTGDGVLSQLDDLTAVRINGQTPVGGSLTGLTVTDANGLTVTVPVGSVVISPDGSFTVTADLTALADGPLTIVMTSQDPAGSSITVTDSLLKDTVTEVTLDPLVVVEGQVPVLTGTAEPGSQVTVTIGGNPPWFWMWMAAAAGP